MPALVPDPDNIRIAMLGMVDLNWHPYSWSAMFNGYNPEEMARCGAPAISEYLGKEPPESVPMSGAKVTHVWAEEPGRARHIAQAALIPNVVDRPEDVIGQVDAVIIPTDRGDEHVRRARPFVEAGLPVFVDKPLVDNEPDLRMFCDWVRAGRPIMSSSCMRYCKEYAPFRASINDLGALRLAMITTPKSWERYGIHALEGIYPILGPGFISARNTGDEKRNVVHLKHRRGVDVVVVASYDMTGGFGLLTLAGTAGAAQVKFHDSFYSFKAQLRAFVEYLRTGEYPFPFSETVELMKLVIAGIESRKQGGREVMIDSIAA